MSSTSQPNKTASPHPSSITLVSHSTLFYWWPVWALGFILGLLSIAEGYVMAVVPHKSEPIHGATVTSADGQEVKGREVLVLPAGATLPKSVKAGKEFTSLYVAPTK